MYWLEVSVVVDGEGAEVVAETLRPYAYGSGVVLEQRGDASSSDPGALEPEVTVKVFLPGEQDSPDVRRRIEETLYHLGRLYPIPAPTFRRLEDEDWANAWRQHYHPFRVGKRLWIRPSWLELDDSEEGDVIIAVDPGMAFGTGLHPSTQMCLRQLEALVQPGTRVMDVGTGSGILSSAAAKLGAVQVLAFDTDYVAVVAAAENAERNGVADKLRLFQGELAAIRPSLWDLVVVNILAPIIVDLLAKSDLADYLGQGGHLVLSGIIEEQEDTVLAALKGSSLAVKDRLSIRDWVCLVAQKA
jgi:ribosomal protein L11 methyltransferase